jgi:hypothetical protein
VIRNSQSGRQQVFNRDPIICGRGALGKFFFGLGIG